MAVYKTPGNKFAIKSPRQPLFSKIVQQLIKEGKIKCYTLEEYKRLKNGKQKLEH